MTEWIVIPNWEKFQHYKDRNPSWIKVYTDLQSKDEWLALSLSARGLLVCIWLEYARSHGQLTTRAMTAHARGKRIARSLDSLREAGFIEISASKPLALARARVEKETEKRSSELRQPRRSPSAGVQPELLGYPEWLATLKQRAAL